MGLEGLIMLVVYVLVALLIAGILAYIVNRAPFIPAEMKAFVVWVIWAVVLIIFLLWLVHYLAPGAPAVR